MPNLQLPLGQEGHLVSDGRPVHMRGMPKRNSAYLPRQDRALREACPLGLVAARNLGAFDTQCRIFAAQIATQFAALAGILARIFLPTPSSHGTLTPRVAPNGVFPFDQAIEAYCMAGWVKFSRPRGAGGPDARSTCSPPRRLHRRRRRAPEFKIIAAQGGAQGGAQ